MKGIHFILFFVGAIFASEDEDIQTEFYLPYSVTEDVDFGINKPSAFGCYQWSTDVEDIVALEPVITDFDNMCGSKLEFRVVKDNGKENIDFKIKAENVDVSSGYEHPDIPAVVEYTIHVRPLAKLEVLGLKTELTAGSDPVPFGVAGYDAEENEFDTLDGLQITWYIGSKRDIAAFEKYRTMGPIVKVVPQGQGKGAVIAVVSDPNYANIDPSYMEFTVKANLFMEPDGAYLLEGANAKLQLFEQSGMSDEEGNPIKRELPTLGEDAEFSFDVKEPEYISFDKATNTVTGVKVGETTVFLKNGEGEIVKGMPMRVVKAHSITVTAEPNPESKQLILDHEYTIKVNIFTKDNRPVYPSENILCKTSYPRQFDIQQVNESGLEAKITATSKGLGKVKASLRSVLTKDDEEVEIIPHLKGSTDFEVYEQVEIKPLLTVLPWDDNVKPNYTLTYKASGGGQVYSYSMSNEEAGSVDNEGRVRTLPTSGPVSFDVKAYMPKSESNFAKSKVHILPATHLELDIGMREFNSAGVFRMALKFFTLLPETNEKVMFTDCSNIPYEIKLSDEENFYVDSKSQLGNPGGPNYCAQFYIKAKKGGVTSKLTVAYLEPSSGRTLRAHTTIAAYGPLEVAHPKKEHGHEKHLMVLPIGSTGHLVLKGGPQPWSEKPASHYKHVEVEDSNVIKVSHVGATTHEDGSYKDEHIYDVICLKEGKSEISFMIGSNKEDMDFNPAHDEKIIFVECSMPNKLTFKYSHDGQQLAVNPKSNRVMAHQDKDLKLTFTLKDKEGKTFTNVDSLNIETKVSDDSLLSLVNPKYTIPMVELTPLAKVAGKPEHVLRPTGKGGKLDVKVKLAGYNQEVLDKLGITNPPALPKVIDDDEDMDYEDEEDFEMHAHSLLDELSLELASSDEIAKLAV